MDNKLGRKILIFATIVENSRKGIYKLLRLFYNRR